MPDYSDVSELEAADLFAPEHEPEPSPELSDAYYDAFDSINFGIPIDPPPPAVVENEQTEETSSSPKRRRISSEALEETSSSPGVSDEGTESPVLYPRAPNVSCRQLNRQKIEEMFPLKCDIKSLGNYNSNVQDENESLVCGACLMDLYDTASFPSPDKSSAQVVDVSLIVRKEEAFGLISSCLHCFHAYCISRWTAAENSCCLCKQRYGALAFYDKMGTRLRYIMVKKTLQSAARMSLGGGSSLELEQGDEVCQVCHTVGDRDSLMHCMNANCDSTAHFYCLDLNERPNAWKCTDCSVPASRRAIQNRRGRTRTQYRSTQNVVSRRQATRLQQALEEIDYDDIQEPLEVPMRLLPSEIQHDEVKKSNVDDLLLGQVPLSELAGNLLSGERPQTRRQTNRGHLDTTIATGSAITKSGSGRAAAPLSSKPIPLSRPRNNHKTSSESRHTTDAVDEALSLIASASRAAEKDLVNRRGSSQTTTSLNDPFFYDPSDNLSRLSRAQQETSALPLTTTSIQKTETKANSEKRKPGVALTIGQAFLDSTVPSNPPSGSSPRKGPTRPLSPASRKMNEMILKLVEKNFPNTIKDVHDIFGGQPSASLQARMVLIDRVMVESVPRDLYESIKSLHSDPNFWRGKKMLILRCLCSHPLIRDSQVRRKWLKSIKT